MHQLTFLDDEFNDGGKQLNVGALRGWRVAGGMQQSLRIYSSNNKYIPMDERVLIEGVGQDLSKSS